MRDVLRYIVVWLYRLILSFTPWIVPHCAHSTGLPHDFTAALDISNICQLIDQHAQLSQGADRFAEDVGSTIGKALACAGIVPNLETADDCAQQSIPLNGVDTFVDAIGPVARNRLTGSDGVAMAAQRDTWLYNVECSRWALPPPSPAGNAEDPSRRTSIVTTRLLPQLRVNLGTPLNIRGIALLSNSEEEIHAARGTWETFFQQHDFASLSDENASLRAFYVVQNAAGLLYFAQPRDVRLIDRNQYAVIQTGAPLRPIQPNRYCPQPCTIGDATTLTSELLSDAGCPTPPDYGRASRDCMGPSYLNSYGISTIDPIRHLSLCDRHVITPWILPANSNEHLQYGVWNQSYDTCRYESFGSNSYRLHPLAYSPPRESEFIYELVGEDGSWTRQGYYFSSGQMMPVGCIESRRISFVDVGCFDENHELDQSSVLYLRNRFSRYFGRPFPEYGELLDPLSFPGVGLVIGDTARDTSRHIPMITGMLVTPRFGADGVEESELRPNCALHPEREIDYRDSTFAYFGLIDDETNVYRDSIAPIRISSTCDFAAGIPIAPRSIEIGLAPLGYPAFAINIRWPEVCSKNFEELSPDTELLHRELRRYASCGDSFGNGSFVVVRHPFHSNYVETLYRSLISSQGGIPSVALSAFSGDVELMNQALLRFFAHVAYVATVRFESY